MASKQVFKVTETVIAPNVSPVTTTVRGNLTRGRASKLRDQLESSNEVADLNPNKLVSYLFQPA